MSEYGDVIRSTFGNANSSLPAVVGDIDANPDQAARAMELGKLTGAPASAIFGDLEEFERQTKSQVAASIVHGNFKLQDFVASDPMVPRIANDDYGTLDKISNALELGGWPMKVLRAPEALAQMMWPDDPTKRFTEAGPLGSWIKDTDLRDRPFASAVAAGLGTPIELTLRGLGGIQMTAADAAANLAGAAGQKSLGRDLGGMIESAGLTGRTGLHNVTEIVADTYGRIKPWVENGREPPPTVLPEYDAFRAERNMRDVEALSDVVADAQTSTLRERNPDLFRDFISRHTDAEIGISGDAIAALYGERVPTPDDGLLGWVPGIAEQLELARKSGDDISVPLADWVAKVDPEVMKALSEDIRVRPGAITAREAALASEMQQAEGGPKPPPLPEEVPTLRSASALEPMLSVGDRKLQMQRMTQQPDSQFGVEQGFHDFNLLDEKGNTVGFVNISSQDGGKTLYVDNIAGVNGLGPRDFGPALMRDLMKQLKAEFPEATKLTGHRVSGAREAAGVEMTSPLAEVKLDKLDALNVDAFRRVLEGGQWETYSPAIQGYVVPDALRQEQTNAIANAVRDELDRIVPQKVAVETPETLKVTGTVPGQRPGEAIRIGGVYIRYKDTYPIILAALDADNVMLTARHEAVHHLRQYGFFTKAEWETLEAEALAGNWFKKHRIDERYPNAKPDLKLEEAIAEEYPKWVERQEALRARGEQIALPDSPLDAIFRRLHEFFTAIRERVSQILGKEATWEDVFKKVDTGEVGRREGTRPLDPTAFDERLSVEPPADPARVFERANALGMTIDQYKRYEKLIGQRHAEDIEAATNRITKAQRTTQTKEWKANRAALRQQVAEEINLRPDIAADNYFADGILYGEKVERIKFGTDFLTEEQRAALPRDYYRKDGVHPDDLAPLFGFPNGQSLVQHLSGLSEVRRRSGMRPIEFKRRMINIETDRQMQLRYGVLEDNIIDAAKEQIASETQLNLLAEETIYYGIKSGQEPAFDQAAIKRVVADEFEASSTTSVSSDRYLAAAGRAGRAVENALLRNDFEAAFREKQRQYYATLLARNAVEFEARVAKFEKLSAKLVQREVKSVEPEYLDYIHELLLQTGTPIKRSADEVARSKEFHGNGTLTEFANRPENIGYDLDKTISPELQSGGAKPLDAMTVAEMQDYMDAVTSLNHVGRAVRKIELAGEKADFATFREQVIAKIGQLPARSRKSQSAWSPYRWRDAFDAPLTKMEEIIKDLDLREELGPLWRGVFELMTHGKAHEFDLMTDLSKHFQETRGEFSHKWRKSLNDTIEQDLIVDPYTSDVPSDRVAYDMTRENLINIMLNWGNRSNRGKMVQGAAMAKFGRRLSKEEFPVFQDQIKALIDKHATLEDWQFVQRMWQPFKKWQSQMEDVSRNTTGVAPKLIEIDNVETPFGTFEGGYWPVKYDRLGSNAAVIEDRKPTQEGVFGGDYFRAATAKGHLKERTGYVDFVDISTSLEQAAGTMQQTIHDIAFRGALIQASRVFYDKRIRAAIRRHYGAEYEAQLVPWLRDVAHQFSSDDAGTRFYNNIMRRMRINLVGHALPLNLKVILSPDVGVPDPKAWASFEANRAANVKLAMEKSDEIRHLVYNMDRDYRESLARVTLDPTIGDLQKKAVQWGFVPIAKVSQEFRMSTFVDQYNKALARGKTEAEAAAIADYHVRERHGAASVVDLPAIMRGNEFTKMLTMFYGFFNTMYNWQRQLPGNVRRGEWDKFGVNALGSVVVGAAFGATLFNQRKQDDSWFKIIAKAMLLQPLSTIPLVREAASYTFEGFQPRTPYGSLLGAAGSIYTDVKKASQGKRVEKPITHVANVIGLSTGLPLAQAGRTTQFGVDVARGRQRPKNIIEWARGIITGESKLKR